MKKLFGIIVFSFICSSVFAQAGKTSIKLISNSSDETIVDISIGGIQQNIVSTTKGDVVQIGLDQGTQLLQKDAPDLPKLSYSLIIPNQKNSTIQILESDYTDYSNILVAPSKGRFSRDIDPSSIPYVFGSQYMKNEFFPSEIASLNEPYILRDFRGQSIHVNPVQYNPVTKVMRVFNHLKLKVSYEGISNINTINSQKLPTQIVHEFDGMYANNFLNYKTTSYTPVLQEGSILILCPAIYLNEIQPFVKWKEMKGFKTYLVNTDTLSGGITENNLNSFVSNFYQSNAIAYLIIVGDNTDLPPRNENYTIASLAGPSDIAYAYQSGNDHYPEFVVGRFSGETVAEIHTQIQRTLDYEKTPNNTGNWMTTQIGIASSQGTGDDNQYDYEHIHDIVDSNKNQYNYLTNVELYDGTNPNGGTDIAGNPTTAMHLNAVNDGASLVNYAGHGGVDGVVTTNFSITEVPNLTNEYKLPFYFVVGCSPGRFENTTCFAEAMQRTETNSPTGTIASFMSCINQYWDEPMEAQDEFNAILRGARPANIKNRLGAMCENACCQMNDKYNTASDPTGGSDMTDTWIYFGDPTLELKTKNEGSLTATHPTVLGRNSTFFYVTCPVEDALVGFYYKGEYLASGRVLNGVANIWWITPLADLDTLFITVSKQNYAPYSGYAMVVDFPLSVNESNMNAFEIYPNPTQDFLHINSKTNEFISSYKVTSITGATLLQSENNSSKLIINTKSLSKGVYNIELTIQGKQFMSKFVKQ